MNERLESLKKEIRDDTFQILRYLQIERSLNASNVVRAFNNTFAAHGFNTVRDELMLATIQALGRLTDYVGEKRNADRASYPAVRAALESGGLRAVSEERKDRFLELLSDLEACRPDIKKFRDVHLAHNLIVEEVPSLKYEQVERASELALECFLAMESAFGAYWEFGEFVTVERNYAAAFARALRWGMQIDDARSSAKKARLRRQREKVLNNPELGTN
jgi:hypothetical protein